MLDGLHLGGDVGEDAALGGDGEAHTGAVDEMQRSVVTDSHIVGDGVDADDGVTRAEEKAIEDAGGDAFGIIGRVVGLEAGGEASRQADGGTEAGDDVDLARGEDEVLQAHEFRDGGGDLGHEGWGEGGEAVRGWLRPTGGSRGTRLR